MLGISTCWWSNRLCRGEEIISDALNLGIRALELEYRISNPVFHQMKPRLRKDITVLSIHNFFPIPEGISPDRASGDLFLLSSPDLGERSEAVRYSIRTIEHAYELGAKAVVFHLGKVDMPDPTSNLIKLYKREKVGKREALSFVEEQRKIRKMSKEKNLDAVLLSLEELNREAGKRGVLLGVENRNHFHEIPDLEEIGIILRKFKGGNIGYWHDVGHAKVQENMGLINQRNLLDAYSDEMIGIHLHDIRGLEDHLAPGQGDMDYHEIEPFMKPSLITILEVHPQTTKKQLLKGIRLIKKGIL